MLAYIIDGFNLIHKIPVLKNSNNPHWGLIQFIKVNKLTGSRNNKVIVVFDGGPNSEAAGETDFEVVFSQNKSADEIIEAILKRAKNKGETIVVSDDREIRSFVKREGAKSCRTTDFIKIKDKEKKEEDKEISYSLQNEITEEMRKIWLKKSFSLVELMIVACILVIFLPALLRGVVGCFMLNSLTRDRIVANADARFVMEQIRNTSKTSSSLNVITGTDWTVWAANNGVNSLPVEAITVTYTDLDSTGNALDDNPLAITVDVAWQGREGRQYNLDFSALVSLY